MTAWSCVDCGAPWPYGETPPADAECDSCGGEVSAEPESADEARGIDTWREKYE